MEIARITKRHPDLATEDVLRLSNDYKNSQQDTQHALTHQDVYQLLQSAAYGFKYDAIREQLKTIGDSSRRVDLDDLADVFASLRVSQHVTADNKGRLKMGGSTQSSAHTINEDERTEFTRHINSVLAGDAEIGSRLPIPTDTMQLFDECRDGLILCKLINDSVPDTIDERVLNKPSARKPGHVRGASASGASAAKGLNNFQMTENNNIVITSAKAIGCSVVNVGASDICDGTEHLILGLVWQIIRRGLLSKIDIKIVPELYRLLEDGETIEQFLRLPPDQILLRWFNYHLKAAGWNRRVNNFSKDVSDGENYTVLLNQLKPQECSRAPLQTSDLLTRAEQILQNADRIGCRKYLTPTAMVAGNSKLNLAFVAHLFNTHPCLEPLQEEEKPVIEDFDAEGEREARVFTLWLNSLDVQPGVYNFFEDLKDGTVLLQAFDKVAPGSVVWRRVSKRPPHLDLDEPAPEMSRFKALENTNYAVELAKANNMQMVSIQGADIVDGTRTLVLGMVWQIMRKNVVDTIAGLSKKGGTITDTDIIRWANDKVKQAGKSTSMRSFKDPSLRNAHFFLDLLDALKPGYVDYDLVLPGRTDDECKNNAKLAISIARKIGSLIFIVGEDIVDLRPRLILTFVAALMSNAQGS